MRRASLVLLLAAGLCSAWTPALARDVDDEDEGNGLRGIEITPFYGYTFGGEFDGESTADNEDPPSLDVQDNSSYGLIVNFPAEDNTEWEFMVSRQSTQVDTHGVFFPGEPVLQDLDITYFQVGGTYLFEGDVARPYIVATVGASRFEPGDSGFDSENFFAFTIGGGYKLWPTSRFGLRLEGRFYGNVIDSDGAVFCQGGPESNTCLIRVNSNMLWQFQVLAWLTFRF